MRSARRCTFASLGLVLLCLRLGAAPDSHARVATLLTKISDGDAKQAAPGTRKGPEAWGIDQDDGFKLLREGSVVIEEGNPGQPVRIVVDRSKQYQTMLGYGAAMTDSSAWVLMRLRAKDPELYRHVMTRLFSPAEGAGLSVLRLPMGSSDYTATSTNYTYCDEPSPDLTGFSIAHDQEYIIPALKEARRFNSEIRIIASPWSAPAWMKSNRSLTGVSAEEKARGATCRLAPAYFEVYADYFIKFLEAYRAAGLEIYGLTLQNEPQFDAGHYPCMRMDEADQIRLVGSLGPKLAAKGWKTRIFIHDHNWTLSADERKPIGGDAKADPVASVSRILSDPGAGRYIAGSAWHGYAGGVADMERAYDAIRTRFPDKQILCTELSGWGRTRGPWFGDVDWGMTHAWMGGAQHGCEASVQWNLALDHRFGPTLRADSAATALVAVNTDRFDEARFEREFYALAQMSRAAPPGAQRIAATIVGADPLRLDIVAFALPRDRTSLVVFNRNTAPAPFQVEADHHFFRYSLSGQSIVTFVW